jgi:hypothetical protein
MPVYVNRIENKAPVSPPNACRPTAPFPGGIDFMLQKEDFFRDTIHDRYKNSFGGNCWVKNAPYP